MSADRPTYVNEEALKLLNCSAEMKDIQAMDDLSQLKCTDKDTGLEVMFNERIIQVMTEIDPRLEGLEKGTFFKRIIDKATDKAQLIKLHNFESDDGSNKEEAEQERAKNLIKLQTSERKPINGEYYEARLKKHFFRGKRQAVLVFSNVSA
jgi:hypothetical protein